MKSVDAVCVFVCAHDLYRIFIFELFPATKEEISRLKQKPYICDGVCFHC